ncbi:TMP repeat protein [Salmonella phage 19]|nr:TMP repeat protein [Salmonella phage 19]
MQSFRRNKSCHVCVRIRVWTEMAAAFRLIFGLTGECLKIEVVQDILAFR